MKGVTPTTLELKHTWRGVCRIYTAYSFTFQFFLIVQALILCRFQQIYRV